MIYHRRSFLALWMLLRAVFDSRLRNMTRDDILSHWADGSIARFYSKDRLDAELSKYFSRRRYVICGQRHELYPLPGNGRLGKVKRALVESTPELVARPLLGTFGSFIFAIAEKQATPSA